MASRAAASAPSPRTTLLGWLLLLPLAALAWPGPGALLADDPFPHLAATGIVLLLALPAALLLPFVPGRPLRGVLLWTTLWALVALAVGFGRPDDSFEARRTLTHFAALTIALLGGAHLGGGGRKVLLRGLVLVSLALTGGAFLVLGTEGHLAGGLGDTGSLSQAALPGAVIGAWMFALRDGPWRVLGLFAALGTIAHATLAPVIGGGLAFVAALLASALASPWSVERARIRRRFGLFAALAVFALIAVRGLPQRAGAEAPDEPVASAPAELGGVGVRLLIWKRVPALLASAPVLGVGPGQFQASFPPFRDPREIELSRHGVCSERLTEVEHAHDDYLEGLAEFGAVGGALWLLFLFFAGRAAFLALRTRELPLASSAAAVAALLTNALFHAPLLFNPAAAFPGFVLCGVLLARASEGRPETTRWLRVEVLLAALLAVPAFAWPAFQHGQLLSAYIRSVRDEGARNERSDLITRAIRVVPDSAPAFVISDPASLLEVRPHSVQAHELMGSIEAAIYAALGLVWRPTETARRHLERAHELSPTHPRILRSLVMLEYRAGEFERGAAYLGELQQHGCLGADWPAEAGGSLVVEGLLEAGSRLMFGVPLAELVPEELHAEAQALEETNPDRARALSTLAHVLWARGHVDRGDYATAVRSYRQAWNATRAGDRPGAGSVCLELHAAEVLDGREPSRPDLRSWSEESGWSELPDWAREALTRAGCAPAAGG